MLKKTISYTNFNDEPKTLEAYFHLGKADIARVAADPKFLQEMNEASRNQDTKMMLAKIEHLVRLSYGIRSEDGERFIKTDEIQDAFIHSAAYEEFIVQILTSENGFTNFIKGVFNAKVMKEIQDLAAAGKVPNPFAEPPNPISDKGVPLEPPIGLNEAVEDVRPAWQRENRQPTRAELMKMPNTEMLMAFREHPSLINSKIADTD